MRSYEPAVKRYQCVARPVHLITTMIKWIRTSRLSIKNSLSGHGQDRRRPETSVFPAGGAVPRALAAVANLLGGFFFIFLYYSQAKS